MPNTGVKEAYYRSKRGLLQDAPFYAITLLQDAPFPPSYSLYALISKLFVALTLALLPPITGVKEAYYRSKRGLLQDSPLSLALYINL